MSAQSNASNTEVSGVVVLPHDVPDGKGTLRVVVEDVSRSDAAARVVGRCDLPVEVAASVESIPFVVPVPAFNSRSHYSVRVHLDRSGTGFVEHGDQVSTQSHPVLTHGHPAQVQVKLSSV